MAFPLSPVNGTTAVVNQITYTYDGTKTAWVRTANSFATSQLIVGNLTSSGNLVAGTVGAVSGQFHRFVGNITQTSSGGAVYFNTTGNILVSGNIITGGNIYDSKGDVRASPINSQPGSYTAVATDAGKTITESLLGAAITFNANVFAAGDMVSVINTSAGNITLVQGTSVTIRLAGTATTGNRTVASNGLATLICSVGGATPTFYCSGAGLT
jgi:hypothetical protein